MAIRLTDALLSVGLNVTIVGTAWEALGALLIEQNDVDLLLVEITAVGFGEVDLADLADAARERGARLALLTSRSVIETADCCSLLGAIASLSKSLPVRANAWLVKELVAHAHSCRESGVVFDHDVISSPRVHVTT